jgi:antirestriction protein ArdC
VFWKFLEGKDDGSGVVRRVPLARAYHTSSTPSSATREVTPIEAASRIEDGMPNAPKVVLSDSPRAFYSPVGDEVQMCSARYGVSDERYHETLLYELAHSTGHRTRLNRFEEDGCTHAFGSKSHAVEELVAEIGSAFLGARAGIFQQVEDDNGAYLARSAFETAQPQKC